MRRLAFVFVGIIACVACGGARTVAPPEPMGTLKGCPVYDLFGRFESSPRTPAFDAAARAFDAGLAHHASGRPLDAARCFMIAAALFREAGDVQDRLSSYENAVGEWAQADRLEDARAALERAESEDPELAAEIRDLREHLPEPCYRARPSPTQYPSM